MLFSVAPPSLLGEREGEDRRETVTKQEETHRHKHRVLPSQEVFQGTHLKLPQGVVTLFLPRGLLGTQHDELVDALCHSSREGTERSMGLGVTASSYYFMWLHISAFSSEVRTEYLVCGFHEASSTSSLYTTPIKHIQGRGKADSLPYFWLLLWFLKGSNSSLKKLGPHWRHFQDPSVAVFKEQDYPVRMFWIALVYFDHFQILQAESKIAKDFKSLLSGTGCVDD